MTDIDRELQELNLTAELEQAATAQDNMAVLLARYYHALRKNGLPDPLVHELVVEMQYKLLNAGE